MVCITHIITYLVGGFNHFFHFIYGMSFFPLTNSYFSRWLKPPTRQQWDSNGIVMGYIYISVGNICWVSSGAVTRSLETGYSSFINQIIYIDRLYYPYIIHILTILSIYHTNQQIYFSILVAQRVSTKDCPNLWSLRMFQEPPTRRSLRQFLRTEVETGRSRSLGSGGSITYEYGTSCDFMGFHGVYQDFMGFHGVLHGI